MTTESEAVTVDGERESNETDAEAVDLDDLPTNETVLVIRGISGVMHSPEIIKATASSTGKTMSLRDELGRNVRLDSEEIFTGGLESRKATTYELYTPGRFRARQRANHAPGPQAGANRVCEAEDLPSATHYPADSDEDDRVCEDCGGRHFQTENMIAPRCEACGALDDE